MQEIYRVQHLVHYHQVALFDAESSDSYPIFESGEETALFGARGVVVSTANDTDVEIVVYQGKGKVNGIFCLTGEIEVGNQGLIVGNETTASTAKLSYPPGRVSVSVYVNAQSPTEVTCVKFVLDGPG